METQKKPENSGNNEMNKDRSEDEIHLQVDQLDSEKMIENNKKLGASTDADETENPEPEDIKEPVNSPKMVLTDKEDKDRPDPGTPLAPPQPDLQQE